MVPRKKLRILERPPLARTLSGRVRRPEGLQNSINFGSYFQPYAYRAVTPARASSRNFNPANATFVELHCCDLPHRYWSSRVVSSLSL